MLPKQSVTIPSKLKTPKGNPPAKAKKRGDLQDPRS